MKVFIVFSVPDYIGIDIEFIFRKEKDAQDCVKTHNDHSPTYDQWDYEEFEVM